MAATSEPDSAVRDQMIRFRATALEHRQLKRLAAERGASLSDLLRLGVAAVIAADH